MKIGAARIAGSWTNAFRRLLGGIRRVAPDGLDVHLYGGTAGVAIGARMLWGPGVAILAVGAILLGLGVLMMTAAAGKGD